MPVDFAVFIAGPNLGAARRAANTAPRTMPPSANRFGDPTALNRYRSPSFRRLESTVAGRAGVWAGARANPRALSEKNRQGRMSRGALRRTAAKDDRLAHRFCSTRGPRTSVRLGSLTRKLDDFNRKIFQRQIDGSRQVSSCRGSSMK